MTDVSNFEVLSADDRDEPTRCSFCVRDSRHLVIIPLTQRPELEERIRAADGAELWMGFCAYCVLAMAKALKAAESMS
jgi:hypothetical protein